VQRLAVILVAAVALAAGLFFSARFIKPLPVPVLAAVKGDLIGSYHFRLGSSTGAIVSAADFAGKTLLINFWATWCTPCRREMPMLMELQAEYGTAGLQVIGIALDDVQSVRDFVDQLGISYPILVGAADVMETSLAYGNVKGLLPYSVLVDRDGIIRWQYTGEIQRDDVSSLLDELL